MKARDIQRRILQYLFDQETAEGPSAPLQSEEIAEALGLKVRHVNTSLELLRDEQRVSLEDTSSFEGTSYFAELTALGRTLVEEPDYLATSLEAMIADALPESLRSSAPQLASPLAAFIAALNSLSDISDPAVLRALVGSSLNAEGTGISIRESDNSDVTVSGTVAGRDAINITINVPSSK